MGKGKGGEGDSGSTTQKVEPWEEQKGALIGLMEASAASTGGVYDEKIKGYRPFVQEDGTGQFYGTMFAPNYFSGQTVADQDPYTSQAIDLQAQRALNGNYGNTQASNQMVGTMQGNYLNSPVQQYALNTINQAGNVPSFLQAYNGGQGTWTDPGAAQADISKWQGGENGYLDSMVNRAQSQSLANTAASFSKSGRYGSGAHEAAAHDASGNIANQMYGQAYEGDQNRDLAAYQAYTSAQLQNAALASQGQQRSLDAYNSAANRDLSAWQQNQSNMLSAYDQSQNRGLSAQNMLQGAYDKERGNMMSAMQFAPTLAQQDYQDIASLSEAGAAKEGRSQSLINADIDRYNYEQSIPLTALQNYGSMISGNYGSTSTATTKGGGSSNPLGGVLSGAMGGAALGSMTGMGAGYGAMGGGLLGLLGG